MFDEAREAELAQAAERVGEVVLERYRLEQVIGCGGVAVVFRALDCSTGDIVAVKTLRTDIARVRTAGARFLREARIALTLNHSAIPRGIAVGTDAAGHPLLVMECVFGDDFGTIMARDGALPLAAALRLGARVADALEAAHRAGIVHRDIKPSNLMLIEGMTVPDGVCVLDFGIAHCLDEPRLSAAGMLYGSPPYMSPEQCRGELVSPASDIYSLGATLVELITGSTLFAGESLEHVIAHAASPPPDLRARCESLSLPVEKFLLEMLAKEPADRPAPAHYIRDVLNHLARQQIACEVDGGVTGITDGVIARGEMVDRVDLQERLKVHFAQLHGLIRVESAAKAKVIERLMVVTARRMERAENQFLRHNRVEGGDVQGRAAVDHEIARLGEDGADQAAEARLEEELAQLHRHACSEQEDLIKKIRSLQSKLIDFSGS